MVLPGRNYTLTATLRRAFRSLMGGVHTTIPGTVEMYDDSTRRAG